MVAVEWDVLVGVSGFAIDVEIERSVRIANDGDIKHGYPAVCFDLFRPFDVRMDGVEVVVEGLYVVVVDGDKCVVCFPQPEKDELTGIDVGITSGEVGQGRLLKVFHVDIRQWAAGGFAHAESFELLVKGILPPEVGQIEIEFDHG